MRLSAKARVSLIAAITLLIPACADADAKGRGLLEGQNSVFALSLLLVGGAVGLILLLALADRIVKSRNEAAALPDEPDDDEPVIAGIRIGSGSPPRWLYAAYVAIPIFAFLYVLNVAEFAPEQTGPTPPPDGGGFTTVVHAKTVAFDTKLITLPAETDVELEFINEDSVPHNIAAYENEDYASAAVLFKGELITADEITYGFKTPAVGEYYFHCDVHPGMNGTLKTVAPGAAAGGEESSHSEEHSE